MKIVLIEKTIEHVQFKLEVDTSKPNNTLAGSPTLLIDGEPHIIYAVDTLTIIKAIANAKNMIYIKKYVKGCWAEESIIETIEKLEKEHGLVWNKYN